MLTREEGLLAMMDLGIDRCPWDALIIERTIRREPHRFEEFKAQLCSILGEGCAQRPWGQAGATPLHGALQLGLLGFASLMLDLGGCVFSAAAVYS